VESRFGRVKERVPVRLFARITFVRLVDKARYVRYTAANSKRDWRDRLQPRQRWRTWVAVAAGARKRTKASTRSVVFRTRLLGYILLAPAMIYIIGLVAIPFFLALKFSLTDATVSNLSGERGFIGLENFTGLL